MMNLSSVIITDDVMMCVFDKPITPKILVKLFLVNRPYRYTEQNYKCNTLVFAPSFHELNSKI